MTEGGWKAALALCLGSFLGCSGAPLEEAQTAYDAGDYDKAIAKSSEAISSAGSYGAYLLRGKAYEKKGEPAKAIDDFEQSRKADPGQGEPTFRETRCYLVSGRPVEAESTITGALRNDFQAYSLKDQMMAHAVHGEVQLSVGDYSLATRSFGEAIKVAQSSRPLAAEPAAALVYYNLSRSEFEQGAYRRARDAFQGYLDGLARGGPAPDDQDLYTLTVLHFLCGDIAPARKMAAGLGPEYKARADAILAGDTFSVRALYEPKSKPKDSEPDSNR